MMTIKEFKEKHNFTDLDMRNLRRYEDVRNSGVMNMFEYIHMMTVLNTNGGERLAKWILVEGNYKEYKALTSS